MTVQSGDKTFDFYKTKLFWKSGQEIMKKVRHTGMDRTKIFNDRTT